MAWKEIQGSSLFCNEAWPMAVQIDYGKRAEVDPTGPTMIEMMMRGETHAPEKKEGKDAHNEDEPVATHKDKIADYNGFDNDSYNEEECAYDEEEDTEDDEDDSDYVEEEYDEDDDDVEEGEDDQMGEGDDDVEEGEDDQMCEGEDGKDDDVDEVEDEDAGIFKCGSVEKEEDGGGDVQNPSLLQCDYGYVQKTSEPLKDDHNVGPLETFTITVQGTCLDPFIPTSTKARYWALCSSRGAILHSRLHLHYLPKAAAAAVASVVELADSIWAATPDLPISTFDGWIADAKELEAAGLDVSFLRERIEQLRAFVSGKQGQPLIEQNEVRRRYGAITRELRDMEGQIGRLMKKKEELGRVRQEVAALLPDLWPRAEACWDAFAELVAASW